MISPKDIYHQEAEELLADIEEAVLDLEAKPYDNGCIDRIFRSIHTIKGSGAMFGFDKISEFSHYIETILDYVRSGKLQVNSKFIDLILASRDHIKSMLNPGEDLILTEDERSIRLIKSFQSILPQDLRLDKLKSGLLKLEPEKLEPEKNIQEKESFDDVLSLSGKHQEQTFHILFRPGLDILINGTDPILLLNELRNMGHCIIKALTGDIPLLKNIDADKCFLAWEIFLITEYNKNAVYDVFIFVKEGSQVIIKNIQPSREAEELVPRLGDILINRGDAAPQDVNEILDKYQEKIGESFIKSGIVTPSIINSALIEQKFLTKEAGKKGAGSLRVSSNKLDNLINLVGELVITQARISQLAKQADDIEEIDLEKKSASMGLLLADLANPIEILERLTADLRDCALDMRMIPIGTIFGKFRRLVRDLSAELGKDIELELYGAETELDKTVIERLNDPLMHLIRNSIDHGIRTPDTRVQHGKNRTGKIKLTAAHKGPHVAITIEDDGMGFDWEAIKQRAIEKGLIKENAELNQNQIFSLVFLPGFSTARQLTSISGRGVGLDVVKQEIDSLGGTIQIKSITGKSTCITMLLPLTLAIIDGLLMEAGDSYFVLPLSLVAECTEIKKEFIDADHERNMLLIRKELIPFIRLKEIFAISGAKKSLADEDLIDHHLAVVRADGFHIGIVADRIIGNIQTVIKSLDKRYQNAEGISGAAIMGDGSLALVIDISGLIRCAIKEEEMFYVK
ncbi:Chemotaxis protein [Desulfonema limicola]|uniref:Chemotaxis protein CheA n=1 Tax=Desulfonema limicola TaxID=45656 RepID=A0A975BCQ9_9BACT|nr:chemotaxis protein CheA [Desulfonema limicola]QTA82971.1 Chemotaxis protein [Desulfonema limicola]